LQATGGSFCLIVRSLIDYINWWWIR